jgi:hypothetical protein
VRRWPRDQPKRHAHLERQRIRAPSFLFGPFTLKFLAPVKLSLGGRMDRFAITQFALFAVAMLMLQVAGLFVIVYFAARLAIRHERRVSR